MANSPNSGQNVKVTMDRDSGEKSCLCSKRSCGRNEDESSEILLEEAREISPRYSLGDIAEIEVTPRQFGRVAAQSAKQVVIQRIKEAERNIIYNEFIAKKEYDIITGTVIKEKIEGTCLST